MTPYVRCQANRKDGNRCWSPAMYEQHIEDLTLCWIHTAQIMLATEGVPTWARLKAAERRGLVQLYYQDDGLRVVQ